MAKLGDALKGISSGIIKSRIARNAAEQELEEKKDLIRTQRMESTEGYKDYYAFQQEQDMKSFIEKSMFKKQMEEPTSGLDIDVDQYNKDYNKLTSLGFDDEGARSRLDSVYFKGYQAPTKSKSKVDAIGMDTELDATSKRKRIESRDAAFRVLQITNDVGFEVGVEATPTNYRQNEFFKPENYGAIANIRTKVADFASNVMVPDDVRSRLGVSDEDIDKATTLQTAINNLVGEIVALRDSGNISQTDRDFANQRIAVLESDETFKNPYAVWKSMQELTNLSYKYAEELTGDISANSAEPGAREKLQKYKQKKPYNISKTNLNSWAETEGISTTDLISLIEEKGYKVNIQE